jgi:hypothetical protein
MYNNPMRTFRGETGLYLLALTLAMAVRLIGLGALPLSDLEAGWALQALDVSNGVRTVMGSQPAYVVLTAAAFFVFGGASNALARLIPALAGSVLILVPLLFKERLKPRTAVILAFALALEPGLAAISRQAGSSILAVTFPLAAWGLWEKHQFHWAGVCAGMALLSGPALWVGLLGLAITWALLRPFEREDAGQPKRPAPSAPRGHWITAGLYALGAIFLLGTMFMTVPAGLGAWTASLPDYVAGWTRASDMPVGVMLFSIAAYQPLGLLLAMIAIVRGWLQSSLRVRRLSLWMVVALLLAVFYPSRQVVDLAWMLIPLWALASLEVARNLNVRPGERREVLGAMALIGLILVFIWLDYLALVRPAIPPDQRWLRTWLLAGSFFLLVVSLLLVALGWSKRVARFGAVWGLAAFLGLYSFGALMAAAGHRHVPNSAEMWRPGARLPMASLLLRTVQDQSAWSNLDGNSQPVTIAGIESPALRWLLRDRQLELRAGSGAASNPPMVITPDQQDPALVAKYRGQGIVWRSTPLWRVLSLPEWLPRHEAAHESETVILWVRNDLFPDARPR